LGWVKPKGSKKERQLGLVQGSEWAVVLELLSWSRRMQCLLLHLEPLGLTCKNL
jgi:hypothetical protein